MRLALRLAFIIVALAAVTLAAGFLFDQRWPTQFWPFFSAVLLISGSLAVYGLAFDPALRLSGRDVTKTPPPRQAARLLPRRP
jgi:hypothetical protein